MSLKERFYTVFWGSEGKTLIFEQFTPFTLHYEVRHSPQVTVVLYFFLRFRPAVAVASHPILLHGLLKDEKLARTWFRVPQALNPKP